MNSNYGLRSYETPIIQSMIVTLKEVKRMRIKYSKDADILLISLREGKLVDSIDLKEGVILHLDENGLPLEIEILDAAKLSMMEEISVSTAFVHKQDEKAATV